MRPLNFTFQISTIGSTNGFGIVSQAAAYGYRDTTYHPAREGLRLNGTPPCGDTVASKEIEVLICVSWDQTGSDISFDIFFQMQYFPM